jgi:hypothetical protein
MQRRFSTQSWKVAAAVVLIAMAAAACGGGDDSSADTIAAGDESQEERGNLDDGGSATPEAPAGDADAGGEAAEGGDSGLVVQPVQINRDIIYTAELTIAVSDVATAADEAIAAILGAGGFLFGERTGGAPRTARCSRSRSILRASRVPSTSSAPSARCAARTCRPRT